MTELIIFTGGICLNNGKQDCKASFGVHFPNKEFDDIGEQLNETNITPTNNRVELAALLKTLQVIKDIKDTNITINSNSEYCVKCVSEWYKKWIKNNWKNANKKPVVNSDLIKEILTLKDNLILNNNKITFKYIKVKCYDDTFESNCNNIVDELAKNVFNS